MLLSSSFKIYSRIWSAAFSPENQHTQSLQTGHSQFLAYKQSCWYFRPSLVIFPHSNDFMIFTCLPSGRGRGGRHPVVYVSMYRVWGGGPLSDKELTQSPFPGHFSDDDILYCLLWVLSFYGRGRGYSPTAVGSDACTQESQIGNKKTGTKTVSTFTINLL